MHGKAYLRKNVEEAKRYVVINYRQAKNPSDCVLECIDFVGISGDQIESRYLEWANPEAATTGLKPGEAEGGQGVTEERRTCVRCSRKVTS